MFNFFNKGKKSKTVAKDRLKLVLIHDRANCDTEILEMMRNDILDVIKKYMDFDESELEMKIGTTDSDTGANKVPALFANIPIKDLHRPRN